METDSLASGGKNYKDYLVKSLKEIGKTRKVEFSGSDIAKLQCPNPEHKGGKEKHPSFRINLVNKGKFKAGSGKCHTCGLFLGSFKRVAAAVKRPDLISHESTIEQDEDIEVNEKHSNIESSLLGDDDTNFKYAKEAIPWPKHQIWRTIAGKLINAVGGKLYFDHDIETQMLYLPCMVNGLEVGGIRANLEKRGKANYFNTSGSWTKNRGLFPYDYIEKMLLETDCDTLSLVEGPRDSLNSIQNGILALGILGIENWTEVKAELILALPIKKLILAFDPNEAGQKATRTVYKTLKNDIPIRRFDFSKYGDENLDPGCMPTQVAEDWKRLSQKSW